jgi:hypothetical protein
MKIINRGIVGSWRKGGKRTFYGFLQLLLTVGTLIFFCFTLYQHAYGQVTFREFRAVAIITVGVTLATAVDGEQIWYFLAWVVDDKEVAYISYEQP